MKPSKQSDKGQKKNSTKVKPSGLSHFTRLTEEMLKGRKVSKSELGQSKGNGQKSVVLVP